MTVAHGRYSRTMRGHRPRGRAIAAASPALTLTSFGAPAPISDRGLALLASPRLVRRAETLHLDLSSRASGKELARLLSLNDGPLRHLIIEGPVSDFEDCVKQLSCTRALKHLYRFDSEGLPITDRGLEHLLACL